MKKSFLILWLILLCIPGFSQKYFEGIVDYDITFQVSSADVTEEVMKSVIGTRLKLYHKDGTYMREYLGADGESLHKLLYLTKENKLYNINALKPDTIVYTDVSKKYFDDYHMVKGPMENILDCNCPSRIITYKYFEKSVNDTVDVRLEYFFCHQLPVNPEYYKNYYLWYDVVKQEKSIAIKFTEEWEGYFKITYTAKKIDHVKVADKTFGFDKNAVLVEKNMKD